MIPKNLERYVFSFITSLLMSGFMSLVFLSLESSTMEELMDNWPKMWCVAMAVAFPVSLFVVPLTRRLVSKIVAS